MIKTISVGDGPNSICFDPVNNIIYVADAFSNSIISIDSKTDLVTGKIIVGNHPSAIALDPVNQILYVANYFDDTVSVIDINTNKIVEDLSTGSMPFAIAFCSKTHTLYVSNFKSKYLNSISEKLVYVPSKVIPVGKEPSDIDGNSKTGFIYVTNADSNSVSVIDDKTNNVIETIQVGNRPTYLIADPNSNMIYVLNDKDNSVSIINGQNNSVVSTLSLSKINGFLPFFMAMNRNELYIPEGIGNTIKTVNITNYSTGIIKIDSQFNKGAWAIVATKGDTLYITNIQYDLVYVLN
ncbi:MAG: hypothetical protein C0175_05035 [Caldisericum exile]|uniref:YNCE-like beta-propeller domain-containing protein n=1 Tax=Caldisericum exile TaxID=693075 RepID=A0A2J6X5B5_9BACT|nr:MAG: hypothetical protein C0175_05035 [Caldisericum exile]